MNLAMEYLSSLKNVYRNQLLENVIPFWLNNGRDTECGGYVTCLDRDGKPYELNKICMWNSGRMIWSFSHYYNEIEPRPEWLGMARHGLDFVIKHGFNAEGRMYYSLTREGQPLEKTEIFTEIFHIIGFSEFARATHGEALAERAWQMFLSIWNRLQVPDQTDPPLIAQTAPVRAFGHALITLNVLDELRRFKDRPQITEIIDQCLYLITQVHTRREKHAAFEFVLWDGTPAPGNWGRWVNPGHMIEAGIFMIHEGLYRNDSRVIEQGIELIGWGFELGWDKEFGGVYNDVDIENKPFPGANANVACSKLWWQHTEALYGTLLAYVLTGRQQFLDSHKKVHEYSFRRFADGEFGEWFALLDRRGNRINDAKGTARKSIFHLGRNLFYCWRLLERTLP